MDDHQEIHARHSLRLRGYDYRQNGAYFVTVCVHNREGLLGRVESGEMRLDAVGQAVVDAWQALPALFTGVRLDAFVVMPNHIHGVLWIDREPVAAQDAGAASSAPCILESRYNVDIDQSRVDRAPLGQPDRA